MSQADKSKGFKFWPTDWLAATRHLSDGAYAAYHRMLCWMWLEGPDQCKVPNNPEALAIAMGVRGKKMQKFLNEIQNPAQELLKIEPGFLVSARLQKEAGHQAQVSQKRRDAANARHNKAENDDDANASHLQCKRHAPSPSPSPIPSPIGNDIGDPNMYEGDSKGGVVLAKVDPPNPDSHSVRAHTSDATAPSHNGKQRGILSATQQTRFDAFWTDYPRKVAKGQAEKAWASINPGADLAGEIMAGLSRWKNSQQWRGRGKEYIKHPATWLRAKDWESDPDGHLADPDVHLSDEKPIPF